MTISIYAVRISAKMLVRDVGPQSEDAERILMEAVAKINKLSAVSAKLSSLDIDPGDPA